MEHPYGWLSLLPPVVAIALAILTRHAVMSLLVGVFCGALLTAGGDFFLAVHDLFEVHLWPTIIDPSKLRVFCFTMLMGGLVALVIRSGGMQGFVRLISPLAKSRRGGQMTTWLMGMLIFFDDYANSLLLGNTFRPVCDRLRISREKLAYIVDSTAAPVAGLSLLSTWVAVEIDFIRQGLDAVGNPDGLSPVELFVASIPYRFYVLGALVLVPLLAWTGRDFGPMLAAERRSAKPRDESEPLDSSSPVSAGEEIELPDRASHWANALIPILVTLGMVMVLIRQTGLSALRAAGRTEGAFDLRDIIGAADSSFALQYGSLCGIAVAVLIYRVQGLLSLPEMVRTIRRGAGLVIPAIAILWFASALSRMTSDQPVEGRPAIEATAAAPFPYRDHRLYTGAFLGQMITGPQSATSDGESDLAAQAWTLKMLPTITFVLAGVVSFCTGTSFGTMGMLVPLVLPLTYGLLAAQGVVSPDNSLLLAVLGSVLAGAIFGDHCSPISDTTIMSSQASGCDHMAHVVTQMPYALTVGALSILLGTLPVGWGVSTWILLPLQLGSLVLIVRWYGQTSEPEPASEPESDGVSRPE
jgi:Na+/H+ antiporter NhaC